MFLFCLFCCVSRHTALYPELLTCSGDHFRKPIDTKTVLLWAAEAYARILCIFERMYANVRILTCGELARGRGKACSARVWADWGWSGRYSLRAAAIARANRHKPITVANTMRPRETRALRTHESARSRVRIHRVYGSRTKPTDLMRNIVCSDVQRASDRRVGGPRIVGSKPCLDSVRTNCACCGTCVFRTFGGVWISLA